MNVPVCELCGEPMPKGEEMFKYHGYGGLCPKPPLKKRATGRIIPDLTGQEHICEYQKEIKAK